MYRSGLPVVALVAIDCLQEPMLREWETYMEQMEDAFCAGDAEIPGDTQGTQFNLAQTEVHRGFEQRVEEGLDGILSRHGLGLEGFLKLCGQTDSADPRLEGERQAFAVFAQVVLSATDFHVFADIMRDREKRRYLFSIMRRYREMAERRP